jgi:pimeloyl-ACP methyl ester carboxylesterase
LCAIGSHRFSSCWGIHDPIFSVAGAYATQREQPRAEVRPLDAGHFAINDRPDEIADRVRALLKRAPV